MGMLLASQSHASADLYQEGRLQNEAMHQTALAGDEPIANATIFAAANTNDRQTSIGGLPRSLPRRLLLS